ncbi:hypothetical protein HRR83_007362 [Exophiala dermatitidis]|uniref:BZIP domain-containing protein n=2 Tax=Exophiala dermatitidis TaxID=5970 RepID=H6C1V3_EXODN|nr:uncharacterized protein HMPREF1120_06645 [Exophiala dermatitidis NIH/UT8656]KAJ4510336.1 hypothetical protein HRR74_006808 [Exophiala dermatitidis]EHY58640.1 hypothetical protein HMPREF1120_06645 [Exophiala dermatitidis NIH/UT8656]KAJ4510729.1 hypothetical protein HRR73_006801 [Exophiala dermatitidis]KAJ4534944.1 hypothetical protein HRR76_006846 [Exophiala dermatitidis]KAJ4536013.1 hypothetical protein HRR77_007459 [Exophiala dermatitidis]
MSPTHHLQPTLFDDEQDIFSQPEDSSHATTTSPTPADEFPHRTVRPHELHAHSPPSSSSSPGSLLSPVGPQESIDDPSSSYLPADRRETLRRLSLATNDLGGADSYRPRNSPTRPRRASTTRIQPRDEKHARELELNRKAATKCRNRQKAFVENLQERYRKEERRMHFQTSLVHALHDEVVALRNEVMRQSFCSCRYIQQAVSPTVP